MSMNAMSTFLNGVRGYFSQPGMQTRASAGSEEVELKDLSGKHLASIYELKDLFQRYANFSKKNLEFHLLRDQTFKIIQKSFTEIYHEKAVAFGKSIYLTEAETCIMAKQCPIDLRSKAFNYVNYFETFKDKILKSKNSNYEEFKNDLRKLQISHYQFATAIVFERENNGENYKC